MGRPSKEELARRALKEAERVAQERAERERAELAARLEKHGGIVTRVAASYGVTRQTVYNWVDKHGLRELLNTARATMYDIAQDNIMQALEQGDVDVSKFVLTHMPTAQARWSNRTEITGKDGADLKLSPDVLEILQARGIAVSAVVEDFEAMVRAEAAKDAE